MSAELDAALAELSVDVREYDAKLRTAKKVYLRLVEESVRETKIRMMRHVDRAIGLGASIALVARPEGDTRP